jgi:hypothetical protein
MSNNPLADAIRATLISPNETDSNLEPANVVDGLFAIARALNRISVSLDDLVTVQNQTPNDALHAIAAAIENHDASNSQPSE